MTTVVNQDGTGSESSSASWIIALVVIVTIFLMLFYGLPFLRGGGSQVPTAPNQGGSQQQAPQSGSSSKIDVNVPDKLDVNVNK